MSVKIILFIAFIFQTFSLQIPRKYLKSLSGSEISKDVKKKIIDAFLLFDQENENNRTDNRTDPKPDNRTDNRTDPKPDNRTDNRTDPKPDNRTDNKTYDIELVSINTKAKEFTFLQDISLAFTNNKTNPKLLRGIKVSKTKNKKLIEIPLICDNYESDYIISCIGDFTNVQNGIYITYSFEYNHTFIDLETPITFYVQKNLLIFLNK